MWIKTKKDKRIEELERKNAELDEKLQCMYFKHPHIINSYGNITSFGASQILEEGMPAEYAKNMIARKLVDAAIPFIHYDLEQEGRRNMLKGYIQVVTYGSDR